MLLSELLLGLDELLVLDTDDALLGELLEVDDGLLEEEGLLEEVDETLLTEELEVDDRLLAELGEELELELNELRDDALDGLLLDVLERELALLGEELDSDD